MKTFIEILSLLDKVQFLEASAYLEEIVEGVQTPTSYEIAATLTECDRPKTLPPILVQFIIDLFEMSIAEGNADAMNDLGARYYCGDRGFEQDFGKAVYYYNMAAQHGHRQAQENLGYCYYYGRNMPVDYEKAFQYFALGAFDGYLISLYKIGDMYLNGYYVAKNEKEAFAIYQRCLNQMNNDNAKFVGGPVHLRLGNMYLDGVGVEQNPEQAMWHYHAAEYFLYNMVKAGDFMYKKSLRDAIEGQGRARAMMEENLPSDEWTIDD